MHGVVAVVLLPLFVALLFHHQSLLPLVDGIYAVQAVATGPCSIGMADLLPAGVSLPGLPGGLGKLKCTQQGYFELVQCLGDYCVCVDASTGAEATASRTSSNRQAPSCGRCLFQVSRYYQQPDRFYFRPLCDAKTGNYQPKQCKDDNHCFCVNVLSGVQLSKQEQPNAQVHCEDSSRLDFSIDEARISKTETGPDGQLQEQMIPLGSPVCKLPRQAGERCPGGGGRVAAQGVKWYFDTETFECLAFAYSGCGGNDNRFDSPSECWDKCKMADFGGCAGMRMPALNAQGHTVMCGGVEPGQTAACPDGYRCTMLAFMGVCCHSATQDLYEQNYKPSCASGSRPVQMQTSAVPMVLIGKRCADQFCPAGASCVQKEIFAHCCP